MDSIQTFTRSELCQFLRTFAQSLAEDAPDAACRFAAAAQMMETDGSKLKPWLRAAQPPDIGIAV